MRSDKKSDLASGREPSEACIRSQSRRIPAGPRRVSDVGLGSEQLADSVQLEAQIAELRHALAVTEAQRDLYRSLYDSAPTGYLVLDSRMRVVNANLTGARLLGIDRAALVGSPFGRFVASKHQETFHWFWRSILETTRGSCELEILKENGDAFYALLEGWASRLPETGQWSVRLAVLDVTERRHLEGERERLLNLTAQHAYETDGIINAMLDAIMIVGSAGQILQMNRAASRLLVAVGSGTPGESGFNPTSLARRALAGQTVANEITSLLSESGETLWVSASAVPVRNERGEIFQAVVRISDITDLHRLQEERDMLLRSVTHDLRTPITVIKGHAQRLQHMQGQSAFSRKVVASTAEALVAAADRMNRMVQDLVDMARLETGQLRLEKEAIQLRSFLYTLVDQAQGAMGLNRTVLDVPDDLPAVHADPDYLDRIVTNLLTNALKYAPDDSEVAVTAKVLGTEMIISVTDHGPGIAPEEMPYLFRSFRRGKTTRATEGLGLGLYIARLLVEAHGGRIWAQSRPGEGATFFFTLPLPPNGK